MLVGVCSSSLAVRDYYDDPQHAGELHGIDKDKYVAGEQVAVCVGMMLLRGDAVLVRACACVW
jgi:hypothetical protein